MDFFFIQTKRNKCDICDKGFANETSLQMHAENHHNDSNLKCYICKQSSNSARELRTEHVSGSGCWILCPSNLIHNAILLSSFTLNADPRLYKMCWTIRLQRWIKCSCMRAHCKTRVRFMCWKNFSDQISLSGKRIETFHLRDIEPEFHLCL